jgi:hypothetical protein
VCGVGEYLDNVREIERRIVRAEQQRDETGIEAPATPVGIPEDWEEHVNLMFDLIALAYQGNMTRVASFMVARELSTLSYPQIGVAGRTSPRCRTTTTSRSRWRRRPRSTCTTSDLFAQFLDKLKANAGRRRQHLRPLAVPVWQRDEQRQPARSRKPADAGRAAVRAARTRATATSRWRRARRCRT